jgi:hypothetical protein
MRWASIKLLISHVLEVVERLSGPLETQGTMAELRTGSEALEDVFVRVVGADHPAETLDWL